MAWITNHNNFHSFTSLRATQLGMVPKFANPHSLSQDVEIITRSEIAQRAGFTSVVHDENSHSLKRDLDNMLRDTWADSLADASRPSRAKKHRKTAESRQNEDGQLGEDLLHSGTLVLKHPIAFCLVSSMKCPQHIFLDPKPSSLVVYVHICVPDCYGASHNLTRSRGPGYEDDDIQAKTRRTRALSVAVEFEALQEAIVSTWQKVVQDYVIDMSCLIAESFSAACHC